VRRPVPNRSGASFNNVVDESDSDQILTIEELRSLRDRMGAEAAAPRAVPRTAETEGSDPAAAIPLQTPADPWEDLRRRARDQRRWVRPLAAAGCLAFAGGVVTAVVITAHSRSVSPPARDVSTPAVPASVASAPPVTAPTRVIVPSAAEPSAIPPAIPPMSAVTAPSPPTDNTTEPEAASVPSPQTTHRPKQPASTAPKAARPSPTALNPDRQPQGAAADRSGAASAEPPAPCATGCTEPTLTRTPTSWSPVTPP
jgi:hypothetical protein